MAGRLHLLIQLISSQGLYFLLAISWILRSKKALFVFLTVFWKAFQSSIFFKDLYFARSLLQLSFHQLFEYFVMLTIFEFFIHADSTMLAKSVTTFSNWCISKMFDVSNFVNDAITSLMNESSSSLFFMIVLFWRLIFSSANIFRYQRRQGVRQYVKIDNQDIYIQQKEEKFMKYNQLDQLTHVS